MNRILMLAVVPLFAVACGEDLDSGAACPSLCPEQSLPLQETELQAVAVDTTLGPFPIRGTETGLLLASRGDSLDVRGMVRFDSLPKTFLRNGADVEITAVDSSRIFIRVDTSVVHFTGTAQLAVFDVDTTAADTSFAALSTLFREDRRIGLDTISREYFFLDDTLSIAISNAALLAKIRAGGRLRIGVQFIGHGDITMHSVETGLPAVLRFDPAPGDTTVASRAIGVLSKTPAGDLVVANDLRDFALVVQGSPAPTERVAAGGLPAYRSYLRFAVPPFFLDSVVIVRAQLVLVQRPVHGIDDDDLATIYAVPVSAGATVTDLTRAAQLVYPPFSFGIEPVVAAPRDSGEKRIDLVQLFRQWALDFDGKNPPVTALVLRGALEGRAPGRLAFFGMDAPAGLRPKVRLTYVSRSRFGIP